MAKLRINGDSSGYVDLEAPNAASSSTLDLDQVPQKNADTKFDTMLQVGSIGTITNAYGPTYGYVLDVKANSGTQTYMSIGMPSDTLGSSGLVMGLDTSAIRITGRDDKRQIFSTNNIYRMTIHSTTSGGGAVTMQYQPSFNAQRTTNQGIQGGTTLIFDQARHNTGNHYNTSTGIFTAPIAGDYLFTFKALFYAFASSEYLDLYSIINGTTRNRYEQTGNNGQHTQIDYTEVVRLNANDNFNFFANNRNSSVTHYSMYGNENHFSGHILG